MPMNPNGSGAALSAPVRQGQGIPEPTAMPGAVGDLESILLQLQSGQMGAEQLLPLLMLLMSGGGMPGGGGQPQGPPMAGPEQGGMPPDLMSLMGGGF